jgi:hypothetical protein
MPHPNDTAVVERIVDRCLEYLKTKTTAERKFITKAGLEWSPEAAEELLNDAYEMVEARERDFNRLADLVEGR